MDDAAQSSDPKVARTVHVGGVQPEMTDYLLREFFEETVSKVPDRPPCPGSIVSKITVSHEKMFAFMEFTTSFDAEIAICMDGAKFMGHPLGIRHATEKEMSEMPEIPKQQENSHDENNISNHVEDGSHKIVLGGLSINSTSAQVQDMVSQYGTLKAFSMPKDPESNLHTGIAFFSYKDTSKTQFACEELHGKMLDGQTLVCQSDGHMANSDKLKSTQSISPNIQYSNAKTYNHHPNNQHPNSQHSNNQHSNNQRSRNQYSDSQQPNAQHNQMGYRGGQTMNQSQRRDSRGSASGSEPSRILKLLNMVSPSDLSDDEEYHDILLDIREECRLFGKLLRIFVPRPVPESRLTWKLPPHPDVGAIFVEYMTVKGALNARDYIEGRKFNNREIIIDFMQEYIWARMVKTEPALPS